MTDSANEDSVTRLNTQLNKSMVLMEDAMDTPPQHNRRSKSIKINTVAQPLGLTSSAIKSRKSILKKPDKLFDEKITNGNIIHTNSDVRELNDIAISERLSSPVPIQLRPRTLQELVQKEILDVESAPAELFNLDDLSDSEEIWMIDIPRSIDPKELHGQTITLGNKSKIKIKDERYCAVTHNMKCNITCVFNAGKDIPQYKTVNIKPNGSLIVRKKLSGALKTEPVLSNSRMPLFPDNLKRRHPLFGISYDDKFRKRSRKHSSLRKRTKDVT